MNPGIRLDEQDYWHDKARKFAIWGHLMAGGTGDIFFFSDPHGDLNCEDFRRRDHFFDLLHYADEFFSRYLPFDRMHHQDDLTPLADDYIYALDGETYAIYLPNGGTTELNLAGVKGTFEVKWYNPRTGGALADGSVRTIEGGGSRSLGRAPNDPRERLGRASPARRREVRNGI